MHHEVNLKHQCDTSDTAIQAAMDAAAKEAPNGLAPELLKQAGFAYAAELYEVQAAIASRADNSPVRKLSKQQQLALISQGASWLPRMVEEAEKHLIDDRPAAAITASWAFAKVKSIRIEAAAERKRHAVPQVTTAEVIATLKKEKEVVEAELAKAKEIIRLLMSKEEKTDA